jgi:hypothetical protein
VDNPDVAPWFTVCNYSPTGNHDGEYRRNVAEPTGDPTVVVSSGPEIATRKDALGTGGLDEVDFVLRRRILLMQRRIYRHPTTSSTTPYEGLMPGKKYDWKATPLLEVQLSPLEFKTEAERKMYTSLQGVKYMIADAPVEYTVLHPRILALLAETGDWKRYGGPPPSAAPA